MLTVLRRLHVRARAARGRRPAAPYIRNTPNVSAPSTTLLNAAVQAAAQMSSGQAAVAISPHILALAKGAAHAMFLTKLKMMFVVAIAVGAVGTGTTLLTYQAPAASPGPRRTAEAPVIARGLSKFVRLFNHLTNASKVFHLTNSRLPGRLRGPAGWYIGR